MFPSLFLRVFLASLVLLDSLASARYVGGGYSFENDWREVFATIKPRQSGGDSNGPSCRPICGGSSCGSSSCSSSGTLSKRSLVNFFGSNQTLLDEYRSKNQTNRLVKRVFQSVNQNNIATFLDDATITVEDDRVVANPLQNPYANPNANRLWLVYSIHDNSGGVTDFTFTTLKKFSDFKGTNVLNIGTPGLHGCTVLTIISPVAVYMGHFFESLAFRPATNIAPATAFQWNCLNQITGQGRTYRAKGVPLDTSLFTGANGPAIAYIMTPRDEQANPTTANPNPPVPDATSQLFPAQISSLVQTLRGMLGQGLGVTMYNYVATNDAESPDGIALFEYDPNADGLANPNFRLWYEQNMYDGRQQGLIH